MVSSCLGKVLKLLGKWGHNDMLKTQQSITSLLSSYGWLIGVN